MAAESKTYARLTRNAAGLATYSSLWMASDHLLIVSSTGFSETYARIMFSDIKAFFVTPTERRLWWGLVWGLLVAISGMRMIYLLVYRETPIGSAVCAGIAAVGLILNWVLGGGCRVRVLTGVQNTVLPSLVRRKKTRVVLARLQPLIMAAQAGRVPAQAAPAPVAPSDEPPAPTPAPEPAVPPPPPAAS